MIKRVRCTVTISITRLVCCQAIGEPPRMQRGGKDVLQDGKCMFPCENMGGISFHFV